MHDMNLQTAMFYSWSCQSLKNCPLSSRRVGVFHVYNIYIIYNFLFFIFKKKTPNNKVIPPLNNNKTAGVYSQYQEKKKKRKEM